MSIPALTVQANGTGVLTDDQLNTFVQGAALLANARNFVGVSQQTIYLVGLASVGDGGQGLFYFNATSTATDDGGISVIQPSGLLVGRWLRSLVSAYSLTGPLITTINRTVAFFIPGLPPAGQNYVLTMTEAGTLQNPAAGGAGAATVLNAPTGNPVYVTISTIHAGVTTSQGSIQIYSSGAVTFPSFTALSLANGDAIELTFPGSQDATLANISISLRYTA